MLLPPGCASFFSRRAGPSPVWPPPTGWPYTIGSAVAWRRLRTRLGGDLDGPHILRTYARLIGAAAPAALAGGGVAYAVTKASAAMPWGHS